MDFQFPVSPDAFNIMLKPVGPLCNLDCTYCYYLEKKNLFPGKTQYRLDEELLEIYIKQYIAAQNVQVVSFVWHLPHWKSIRVRKSRDLNKGIF